MISRKDIFVKETAQNKKENKKKDFLDRLTFKLEVDVGITVPGFVECIATIQSSIF
jgi:hypothetical protein